MKKEIFYNIAISILLIIIVIVVYVKFIKKIDYLSIKKITAKEIPVSDFMNNSFKLNEVLKKGDETYILILEIDNCGSCILKGINELISLRSQGKYCFSLIVYDRPNEISGWVNNYDFSPFYIINKSTYYKYFKFQYLPLIFTLRDEELSILRYITI